MILNWVLASNSPRRKQLLSLFGWPFQILPVNVDERPLEGEEPRQYVLRLAEWKARTASEAVSADSLIVAADTAVVDNGRILGKPSDSEQAVVMLRQLRGRLHQVYTAIALVRRQDGLFLTDVGVSDVPMRGYSELEIEEYVASGDPLDKAGAYAIQHPGFKPVERLEGCYANVMGLPLCHLTRCFRKAGIPVTADIPNACQAMLNFSCPVYQQILGGEG